MPREISNFQREENESISLSFFSSDEEVISIRASVAGLDNTEESYMEENVSDGSATLYSKDGEFPTPAVLRDVVASSVARHPWTDTRVALNIRNDYSQRERRHLAAILQEDTTDEESSLGTFKFSQVLLVALGIYVICAIFAIGCSAVYHAVY
ncbi:hypothetical protein G9P44_000243 [Scheffersomyces stipitis]|nr:hypothetical protein G9P44_000243 [Scheffersomyces stipitis]